MKHNTNFNNKDYLTNKQNNTNHPVYFLSEFIDNSIQYKKDDENLIISINWQKEFIQIQDNALGIEKDSLFSKGKLGDKNYVRGALDYFKEENTNTKSEFGVGMKEAMAYFGNRAILQTKQLNQNVVGFYFDASKDNFGGSTFGDYESFAWEEFESEDQLFEFNFSHGTQITIQKLHPKRQDIFMDKDEKKEESNPIIISKFIAHKYYKHILKDDIIIVLYIGQKKNFN